MNKLQWNVNRNSCIFIQENAFENVVWKMAAILSRPQCVKCLCAAFWIEAIIGACNGSSPVGLRDINLTNADLSSINWIPRNQQWNLNYKKTQHIMKICRYKCRSSFSSLNGLNRIINCAAYLYLLYHLGDCDLKWVDPGCYQVCERELFNSSPLGQNGDYCGRRQIQIRFPEWK